MLLNPGRLKKLPLLIGIALGGPAFLLLLLSIPAGLSWSGWSYTAGIWMVIAGLIATHWGRRWAAPLAGLGLGLFCASAGARLLVADGGDGVRMSSGPKGGERLLGRFFDERDANATAMVLMDALGATYEREMDGFLPALHQLYDEMGHDVEPVGSPFLHTVLGLQSSSGWDIVEFGEGTNFGVVFLHGASGNIAAYCWVVGGTVADLGGQTLCPSAGVEAGWNTRLGVAVVQDSIERLRARQVERIYLAGLSAGAVGVTDLVDVFEEEVEGLILIAGSGAEIPCSVPFLVIAGENDERFPLDFMKAAVSPCGRSELMVLPGADHFLIVKEREKVRRVLREWLESSHSLAIVQFEMMFDVEEPLPVHAASALGTTRTTEHCCE